MSLPNSHAGESETERSLLETILEGTASDTGEEFLAALVRSLARALRVDGAWVTEYLRPSKRLRAFSFWFREGYVQNYEYDIHGSPCEQAVEQKCMVRYPENVVQLFPHDPELRPLNAVGYMGIPFLNEEGTVLGHLAVLDSKPLPNDPQLETVFRIFAARASAELRRMRAESRIRESEERFARLFESSFDAILELDQSLNICRANPSALESFGVVESEASGRSFLQFLTNDSANKLRAVIRSLDDEGSPPCVWVPAGFEAVRADGIGFPAEASLSRFLFGDEIHFAVILRSIRQQIEAENKIAALTGEAAYLREEIRDLYNFGEILGHSRATQEMLSSIHQVGPTHATVLIQGETGTGKELVARAVHRASRRSAKPLIKVNCAAIPASLMESEFFGHEKGAFTGATQRRVGRFWLADGGTIFLDEIGELPPDLQAKLLRVLQEGEFELVGSSQTRQVDVRVVAATNKDLQREVSAGRFREDLYYRLSVFPIRVPPLRERSDDIGILAEAFVQKLCDKSGRRVLQLTPDGIRRLRAYDWPGNVRELQNVLERAVILSRSETLTLDGVLPSAPLAAVQAGGTANPSHEHAVPRTANELRELERSNILKALEQSGWKISGTSGAARILGLPPSTLSSRIKSLGIRRPL